MVEIWGRPSLAPLIPIQPVSLQLQRWSSASEERMVRKRKISIVAVMAGAVSSLILLAFSDPALGSGPDDLLRQPKVDDRQDPLTQTQRDLRKTALEARLKGKAYGKKHEVARGQYVELEREGEDPVWTVLGDFSDFAHNSIAEPDRNVDNSTIWAADFSRDYYLDMLFSEGKNVNSMRQFYIEQSSNRYTVYGDVTDWVSLPGEACDYDDGDPGPGNALSVWQFLIDSVDGWYAAQIAAGMAPAEIDEYLSQFDIWDRYDWDNDGNFDEPDGYIDHMQFVHAGEGNEAGGGALGDCAIWSHSWFAYFNLIGIAGPSPEFLIGGVQIGNSSYWLNKYTIQPENGGVGVFAHEYGHDLGLPDLYDYTGENSVGFWSAMASGSWLSLSDSNIGSSPDHFGVWEKFQLGWLNYEVAFAGSKSEHKLGPAETNTKQAQGLFVVLPPKPVLDEIAEPYSGDYFYYSGAGNNVDNVMYKAFTLGPGSSLSAMANVAIELDWDYAYLMVSTDGGATWTNVETNLSTTGDPNGQNFGYGITGSSFGNWIPLTADLSAYVGDVLLGFRYWTDGAVVEPGFMVDDIDVSGYPLDDAESDAGWTFGGFRVTTGTESAYFSNYYVAEFRQYRGYDAGLANAYNFGWAGDAVLFNLVEHFPYQDGLLVSYWDNSFTDNNVGANCASGRCGGLLLPVDAHPELMYRADGGIWRNRVQAYDSTFGLTPTDDITLHWQGESSYHPSQPAVSVFDDNNEYWNPANQLGSVQVPNTGTQIRVKSVSAHDSFMQVEVRPSK
jgi:immune inhibitor A